MPSQRSYGASPTAFIPASHSFIPTTSPASFLPYSSPHSARPSFAPRLRLHPTAVAIDIRTTSNQAATQPPPRTPMPAPLPSDPASPVFTSGASFFSLGLRPEIVSHLSSQTIRTPTGIQSQGIPPILGGADVVLGAATGSGKTLAYLLPVVQQLKDAEELRNEGDAPLRVARRPRAIVLVPTRELADQVTGVARALAHAAKFSVVGATGGATANVKRLMQRLSNPVDLLVTTTGRLVQLLNERALDLRFVRHVVIDEVDTMFDAGFGPELERILHVTQGANSRINTPQYIAVGATHPRAAESMYESAFPHAKRVNVDLHRPPPGLEQRFIQVETKSKLNELVSFLGEFRKNGSLGGGRMMVFCNTMASCRFLEHFLSEAGYTTACMHGDMPMERREQALSDFREGRCQLLICSDMAARGLDNLAVEHVVLFDFPGSAVDYIHRAGRTARAGAKGRVTSFVTKRDVRLARAIERAQEWGGDTLESARRSREESEARREREKEVLLERTRRQRIMRENEEKVKGNGRGGARRGRFGRGGGGSGGGRRGGSVKRGARRRVN